MFLVFETHKNLITFFLTALPPTTDLESIPRKVFPWHLFNGRRKIALVGLDSHARRWDTLFCFSNNTQKFPQKHRRADPEEAEGGGGGWTSAQHIQRYHLSNFISSWLLQPPLVRSIFAKLQWRVINFVLWAKSPWRQMCFKHTGSGNLFCLQSQVHT